MLIYSSDESFSAQIINFANKIGTHATTLSVTPTEVKTVKEDAEFFGYVMEGMTAYRTTAQNFTAYKDLLRNGGIGTLGALPVAPTLPIPVPTLTEANVQLRFITLIKKCMLSPNFTDAIGKDLGILAAETVFNAQEGKPTFRAEFSSGGHPNLIWKKGKFQGVEIQKSLDGVNFTKLDKDFSPDFIDKSPLPEAGKSTIWYYRMIYILNDEIVGTFSDVVAVTVNGY